MHLAPSLRSPAPWLLGGLLGVALQLQQAQLHEAKVYAAACALALLGLGLVLAFMRQGRWPLAVLALLVGLLLGWGATGWRASAFEAQALSPAFEGVDITVQGFVRGLPQSGPEMVRFRLEVESAELQGRPVELPRHIQLSWYAPRRGAAMDAADPTESARQPADLRPGERWRMTVRLKAPHGQRNPHGFDQELWLWEQGLQAVGHVRVGPRDLPPQRLASASWGVDGLRQSVRAAIYAQVPDRQLAGILAALVMGDQAAIERSDWDVFRATGVAHLMSISGLHITLFAWLASRVLRRLWQGSALWTPRLCLWLAAHRAGAWGGLALAAAYALFSGWGLPAQRTVCMLAVSVLLQQSSLRWPWPQVWLLAMAAVVAMDPWALMQAGFWLSFVAVGVLLASDPGLEKEAAPGGVRSAWGRLRDGALSLAREQGTITLALTPLTLLLFQQVSVVGLLANALAIPWVTWVVTPLALLGMVLPPLWSAAAWLVEGLMAVLQPMAEWPGAVFARAAAPLWCGVAGLLGGLLMVLRWPWYGRLIGLPLILPVLLWTPPRPAPGEVELLALDVGQGSAVLVRTAGHSLLYDAGPRYSRESDAGHRVLVPALRALGERLDLLVLSHEDSDHIGGVQALRGSQPQAEIRASFAQAPGWEAAGLQSCEAGQRWSWDGVQFEVLHPAAQDLAQLRTPNARSCVLRVQSAGATPAAALLTGDLEAAQEVGLVQRGLLTADWLLVPHHGSKTSSSAAFLQAVQPRFAVVQSGYRNRFGHPAAEVMERYRQQGVQVLRTPECGAASWHSEQPGRIDCLRDQSRRYWHHRGARPGQIGVQ